MGKNRHQMTIPNKTAEWLTGNDPLGRKNPAAYARELLHAAIMKEIDDRKVKEAAAVVATVHQLVTAPDPTASPPHPPAPAGRRRGVVKYALPPKTGPVGDDPVWFVSADSLSIILNLYRFDDVLLLLTEHARVKPTYAVLYAPDVLEETTANSRDGSTYWKIDVNRLNAETPGRVRPWKRDE